jgi:Sortase domain
VTVDATDRSRPARTGPGAEDGRTRRRRRLAAALLAGVGVACLLAGTVVLVVGPSMEVSEIGQRAVPAVPIPADAPVAPGTEPVELLLPGRDVRAPVVAVSTDVNGGLVVPDPPATVGWWSPSALAGGAAGPTVIAGHIDSRVAGIGALAALRHVTLGEEVFLRGADGRTFGYRVTARRQYAKAELPAEVFAAGGSHRLVLITCGGRFDGTTRHYEDNVVVFAEPAPHRGPFVR